ncbi:hypothetical protein TRIUR3_17288 [Triticum urartu]|uniref:Uncharacterized protein n=1 Tax=Triticum urartu TaxID=4572 RepID=M8AJV1_TRIUA|nr:hypothetical protein TRIUR3_17288 [Triticum urartu]
MEGDRRKEGETPPPAEWVQHMKASVVGVWRKATARSEQEAAEADLRAAKEQVEATDEAEAKKKHLAG